MDLIAVDCSGNFKKELYFNNPDIVAVIFKFNDLTHNTNRILVDNEDGDITESFSLSQNALFERLVHDTFIGLCSPSNAMEQFFTVQVASKGTADKDLHDEYSHLIVSGEQCAEILYLEKLSESRKKIKYQGPKKLQHIFLHIYEVFVTNVCTSEDLCLNIDEYQSVLCTLCAISFSWQNVRI